MSGPKITLRIDEIVGATPELDQAALQEALRTEVATLVDRRGIEAFGTGGTHSNKHARLDSGARPDAAHVARAVMRSVVK